ncbi:hypothetical protein ACLB2K_005488 [Fragaria x ananassa]
MDERHGSSKLTGIRQIVKFKEILQKWQSVTLGSKGNNSSRKGGSPHSRSDRLVVRCSHQSHSGRRVTIGSPSHSTLSAENSPLSSRGTLSPAISRRLTSVIACDSDEESCASPEPPSDVPEGYLAVYVGPELRRFIIPTSYLSHNLFKVLLEKAEEEFGFDHSGGLTIPCETETFKYLLKCMENHQKAHPDDTPAGAWKLSEEAEDNDLKFFEFIYEHKHRSEARRLGGGRTHFVPWMKVKLMKGFASTSLSIFAYLTRLLELEPGPEHLYSP